MSSQTFFKQTKITILNIEYHNGNKATVDYICRVNGSAVQVRTVDLTETDLAICAMGQNRNGDWRNNNEVWEACQFSELYPEELELVVRCATHSKQVQKSEFEAWATDEQLKLYNSYFMKKKKFVPIKMGVGKRKKPDVRILIKMSNYFEYAKKPLAEKYRKSADSASASFLQIIERQYPEKV
jgi:hypothetical protein